MQKPPARKIYRKIIHVEKNVLHAKNGFVALCSVILIAGKLVFVFRQIIEEKVLTEDNHR